MICQLFSPLQHTRFRSIWRFRQRVLVWPNFLLKYIYVVSSQILEVTTKRVQDSSVGCFSLTHCHSVSLWWPRGQSGHCAYTHRVGTFSKTFWFCSSFWPHLKFVVSAVKTSSVLSENETCITWGRAMGRAVEAEGWSALRGIINLNLGEQEQQSRRLLLYKEKEHGERIMWRLVLE